MALVGGENQETRKDKAHSPKTSAVIGGPGGMGYGNSVTSKAMVPPEKKASVTTGQVESKRAIPLDEDPFKDF